MRRVRLRDVSETNRSAAGYSSQRELRVPQMQQLEIAMKNSLCRPFAFASSPPAVPHGSRRFPGMVDFGKFTPPGKGGEFVEVNIRSNRSISPPCLSKRKNPTPPSSCAACSASG